MVASITIQDGPDRNAIFYGNTILFHLNKSKEEYEETN
jgi:hypothetical protein